MPPSTPRYTEEKMRKKYSWQYDELKQVGIDYENQKEVEEYDIRHAQFRDVDAECIKILDTLEVSSQSTVIEIGTGTGAFAINAAKRCAKVFAIDVSASMLNYAKQKSDNFGLKNISYHHAGFLTYVHNESPVDALVTSMAFHHLPDFWKSLAFDRMNNMLKSGGLLYIHDVIFVQDNREINIKNWINQLENVGGKQLGDEVATHIREEFSTFDWIIEGLLERSGFKILSKEIEEGVIGTYLCKKT